MKTFVLVLLPRQTASGWQTDPVRLIEVLSFRYFSIHQDKHWKIHGDGREIGGRQSTYVAISILNNDAYYHDLSFHNPKNVYPCNIFYKSDSWNKPRS